MIYFVQRGTDGPVKIGKAVDPHARVRALQTANPEPLTLLAVAPGNRRREAQIHRRLASFRINGEWYKPVPELFAVIDELATPEFIVRDARAYAVLRRLSEDAPTRSCPFCGKGHVHGGGDGHRVAHCLDDAKAVVRSGAVTLRRADGYFVLTDA
jgi:hypothetical protein